VVGQSAVCAGVIARRGVWVMVAVASAGCGRREVARGGDAAVAVAAPPPISDEAIVLPSSRMRRGPVRYLGFHGERLVAMSWDGTAASSNPDRAELAGKVVPAPGVRAGRRPGRARRRELAVGAVDPGRTGAVGDPDRSEPRARPLRRRRPAGGPARSRARLDAVPFDVVEREGSWPSFADGGGLTDGGRRSGTATTNRSTSSIWRAGSIAPSRSTRRRTRR
jgi:hypothetical protein